MKYIIALSLFIGSICFTINSCSKPNKKNPACIGKDRWDVKTLTDAGEPNVNYNPINITVKALVNIPFRQTLYNNTPRFGIEFNTYSIQCRVREYKLSDDGDYHLVLEDLSDPSITMIGEIPDPYCSSVQQSKHVAAFTQARKYFQNTLLVTGQIDTVVYLITGPAFYDKVHGQLGAAPDAIEIHPILSIMKK